MALTRRYLVVFGGPGRPNVSRRKVSHGHRKEILRFHRLCANEIIAILLDWEGRGACRGVEFAWSFHSLPLV